METLPPNLVDLLRHWLKEQRSFPECLRVERLQATRRAREEQLLSPNKLKFLGDESAFVVWETDLLEQDTGRKVANLWAWQGTNRQLLGLFEGSIREFSGQALMVERVAGAELFEELLQHSGFTKCRYRLSRTPQTHELDTLRQGQFRLRQGGEYDRAFLCNLATAHVRHTLPPEREEQSKTYSQSILKRFTELDYDGPDSAYDLLIAEEKVSRMSVGYILLELDEEKSAFILDLGVRESHWGRYVAQFMIRATENLLVEHGIDFLHTEISAANRRSFVTACRSLKFEPRVEQWMRT